MKRQNDSHWILPKHVVAFIGVAGSGKDFQCSRLVELGYEKMAFADALREISFAALGIPYDEGIEKYEELKRTPFINGKTLREFMEALGTEGIRKYNKDFWVNCVKKKILESKSNVCISDMRFVNEYWAIRDLCQEFDFEFDVYFCDYHSERYQKFNPHPSAVLAQHLRDYYKIKDGTNITLSLPSMINEMLEDRVL